jgi:hypothetical protein
MEDGATSGAAPGVVRNSIHRDHGDVARGGGDVHSAWQVYPTPAVVRALTSPP